MAGFVVGTCADDSLLFFASCFVRIVSVCIMTALSSSVCSPPA